MPAALASLTKKLRLLQTVGKDAATSGQPTVQSQKAIRTKMERGPCRIMTTVAVVVLTCQPSLAEIVTLACSGHVTIPQISQKNPTSGVIAIDFDRGAVEGLVSGKIVKITDLQIDFEAVLVSGEQDRAPVYRQGRIDRITGFVWQQDTRSKPDEMVRTLVDYRNIQVTCKPARPQF
jgi:hypothetical protein